MQFSTKVPIQSSNQPVDYSSRIVSLGSCFAENIGKKFEYFKFQNFVNPFGIIFNPVSIEKLVSRAVNQELFSEKDIFFHNDLWHCYEVHSEWSNPDKEVFLENLNRKLSGLHFQLFNFSHCFITYGTAWIYKLKSSGEVVANCHKVPQSQFDKALLSVTEIENSIQNSIDLIQKVNPNCHFLFTVSPVRHIKDGFIENQRSKAHLIVALHQILNPNSSSLNYFPSYEIMMDELRDYRFYAEDMLHPNSIAIDYIWERFSENYISPNSFTTMQEIDRIQKGLTHRPFHPNTYKHQQFLETLNQKIIKLQEQFSHFQF